VHPFEWRIVAAPTDPSGWRSIGLERETADGGDIVSVVTEQQVGVRCRFGGQARFGADGLQEIDPGSESEWCEWMPGPEVVRRRARAIHEEGSDAAHKIPRYRRWNS
jgi:hypothetical protein